MPYHRRTGRARIRRSPSPRREELLEQAYAHVLEHGLGDMSLRPLADAVGSSPRALLDLFGSQEGLVRALLDRAREDELQQLEALGSQEHAGLARAGAELWRWLSASEHRGLLLLWTESYARSLSEPEGTWADFASAAVGQWLTMLADAQPEDLRRTRKGEAERTLVLATLRGALLDLLATGERSRTTAAVTRLLTDLSGER